MPPDIVERLRKQTFTTEPLELGCADNLMEEAAEEIMRLRESVGRYEFWNEKLRRELERLGWEMP